MKATCVAGSASVVGGALASTNGNCVSCNLVSTSTLGYKAIRVCTSNAAGTSYASITTC